jgi:hypothetical protein
VVFGSSQYFVLDLVIAFSFSILVGQLWLSPGIIRPDQISSKNLAEAKEAPNGYHP